MTLTNRNFQESLTVQSTPQAAVAVTLGANFNLTTATTPNLPFAIALWVGTTGNLVAQKLGDAAAITYTAVPSGTRLPGLWISVSSTVNGTTATNIVAEF